MSTPPRCIFFGHDEFSVGVLSALREHGYTPALIVTGPDKRIGRHQTLTSPPIKTWALSHNIEVHQPEKLDDDFVSECYELGPWAVFLVASYGTILPPSLIELPRHNTLNVHPSLLPKHRGADPIRAALLADNATGVTIMRIDEHMDHGPIVAQREVRFDTWPIPYPEARDRCAHAGGALLAEVLTPWTTGTITPIPQKHGDATYTRKTHKEDAEIKPDDTEEAKWRTYCAYVTRPGAYFYTNRSNRRLRVKIADATYDNGTFIITRVIPEGKKEMAYEDFIRGYEKS